MGSEAVTEAVPRACDVPPVAKDKKKMKNYPPVVKSAPTNCHELMINGVMQEQQHIINTRSTLSLDTHACVCVCVRACVCVCVCVSVCVCVCVCHGPYYILICPLYVLILICPLYVLICPLYVLICPLYVPTTS